MSVKVIIFCVFVSTAEDISEEFPDDGKDSAATD